MQQSTGARTVHWLREAALISGHDVGAGGQGGAQYTAIRKDQREPTHLQTRMGRSEALLAAWFDGHLEQLRPGRLLLLAHSQQPVNQCQSAVPGHHSAAEGGGRVDGQRRRQGEQQLGKSVRQLPHGQLTHTGQSGSPCHCCHCQCRSWQCHQRVSVNCADNRKLNIFFSLLTEHSNRLTLSIF